MTDGTPEQPGYPPTGGLPPAPPPPAGYAPPPGTYGHPHLMTPRNGLGVAALVLGILALVFCWTLFLGVILGILGLIFGIIGRKRATQGQATNGGMALAGAITGGLGLLIAIVFIATVGFFWSSHSQDFRNYSDCMNHAQSTADEQKCLDDFSNSISH